MLDYAQAVTGWGYADLQREVSMATREPGTGRRSGASCPPGTRTRTGSLRDDVARNLARGPLMFVIAGDGIREDVSART